MSDLTTPSLVPVASSPVANIPLRIKSTTSIGNPQQAHKEEIVSPSSEATLDHEHQITISPQFTLSQSELTTTTTENNLRYVDSPLHSSSITTTLLQSYNIQSSSSISQNCQFCENHAVKVLYYSKSDLGPGHSTISDTAISICNAKQCADAARAHLELSSSAVEVELERSKGRKEVVDCRLCGKQSLRAVCAICRFSCKITRTMSLIMLTLAQHILPSKDV